MQTCVYEESIFMNPTLIESYLRQVKNEGKFEAIIGYLIAEINDERCYFPIQASMMEIHIPSIIEISGVSYIGDVIDAPILKLLPYTKEIPDLLGIPAYLMNSIRILDNDIGKRKWYFDDELEFIPNCESVVCSYDAVTGSFVLRPKLFIMHERHNADDSSFKISVQIV